jgi:hypothetical protein
MAYVRDPALLARPARRIRLYRRFANLLSALMGIIIALSVLNALVPSLKAVLFWVWAPFGVAALAVSLPGFLSHLGFWWGFIRCPCCSAPFLGRVAIPIANTCENCGFDVSTVSRRGDF